jgi:hypothetical protein
MAIQDLKIVGIKSACEPVKSNVQDVKLRMIKGGDLRRGDAFSESPKKPGDTPVAGSARPLAYR